MKDNDRVLITPLYAAFQERWFMEVGKEVGKKGDQKAASDDANLIHSWSRQQVVPGSPVSIYYSDGCRSHLAWGSPWCLS